MSMPMDLQVVVVSTNSQIAAIAASILRGDNNQGICPWIAAAHAEAPSYKSPFYITSNERRLNIETAASCGFDRPSMPSTKHGLDAWISTPANNLEPWKQRIWDAFRDSS